MKKKEIHKMLYKIYKHQRENIVMQQTIFLKSSAVSISVFISNFAIADGTLPNK